MRLRLYILSNAQYSYIFFSFEITTKYESMIQEIKIHMNGQQFCQLSSTAVFSVKVK